MIIQVKDEDFKVLVPRVLTAQEIASIQKPNQQTFDLTAFTVRLVLGASWSVMAKDDFQLAISNLTRKSSENKDFITAASLENLMTRAWIERALDYYLHPSKHKPLHTHSYHIPDLAALASVRGQRAFAILIHTENVDLLNAKDHAQDLLDDGKLPWKKEKCVKILEDADPSNERWEPKPELLESAAKEMYSSQWIFLPPKFSPTTLHQNFEDDRILPFVGKPELLGEGAYGKVYTLQIDPECQTFLDHYPKLVRKEMEGPESIQSHENELEALGILSSPGHRNILKLLGSYTYMNKRNLIFPSAENGSLEKLLKCGGKSPFLRKDDVLSALVGLASAIKYLHNPTVEARLEGQGVQRKGFHHDLHPRNILLSGTRFILADFGMARFKRHSENSNTQSRQVHSDFLAPECTPFIDKSEQDGIRRSAEIWSYGCILVEILAFMHGGSERVKAFREERSQDTTSPGIRSAGFYIGGDGINHIVNKFLEDLERCPTPTSLSHPERLLSLNPLLALIRDMLSIQADKRPRASMMLCRLSFVALFEISAAVSEKFKQIVPDGESTTLGAERERIRFESWRYALELLEDITTVGIRDTFPFEEVRNMLLQLEEKLIRTLLLLSPVSLLIDRLWEILTADEKKRADAHFDEELLRGDDRIKECPDPSFFDSRRKAVLKIKQMTDQLDELNTAQQSFEIDHHEIEMEDPFGEHRIGTIKKSSAVRFSAVPQRVLVEWREPTSVHSDEGNKDGQKFVEYTNRLSKLLAIEKPTFFHALTCRGFIRGRNASLGLVFNLPAGYLKPVSLFDVITICQKPKFHPFLEDKFRLAHALAEAVYHFHQVGWFHKRLRPSNIIFFAPRDSAIPKAEKLKAEEIILNPYIVGFSHSRPNERDHFTEFSSDPRNAYSHPDYLPKGSGFRQEYDYYSLGLILFEIGQWHPVANVKGSSMEKMTVQQRRDEILQNRLHILRRTMGKTYYEVVKTCLDNNWASDAQIFDSDQNQRVREDFHKLVVCQLQEVFRRLSGTEGIAIPK
ncbi:hypothetical protein J7T55_014460 [Diaporthe amygdali]|uniref:uncharacterized protein n=1 Tax=Phomopsis amygdali TaxID=1214568 RepID=UPI0022FDC08D|nr:uncharacterized protein J7T55_014460 [Diaporthe amygdali]KAJ0118009.1 hypothetical protein J7T55_014460 [Diaporthe amygdali]